MWWSIVSGRKTIPGNDLQFTYALLEKKWITNGVCVCLFYFLETFKTCVYILPTNFSLNAWLLDIKTRIVKQNYLSFIVYLLELPEYLQFRRNHIRLLFTSGLACFTATFAAENIPAHKFLACMCLSANGSLDTATTSPPSFTHSLLAFREHYTAIHFTASIYFPEICLNNNIITHCILLPGFSGNALNK